ncbi:hypothetical protein BGZ65_010337, partial [Modicella reniformis]
MNLEIENILHGKEHTLSRPQPFRNLVAKAHRETNNKAHDRFFTEMLGDIDEPTFPFGISEVHLNGAEITESHQILPDDLNNRLRFQAKQMGVSLASLIHVAFAQVLSRTSGQDRVVFGTVLLGGMQSDHEAGEMMGLSINTLPIRCDMGESTVRERVHQTHLRLAALMDHKHASLSMAQRCSGVDSGTPLFSALLNYLHTSLPANSISGGSIKEFISQEEQVHYPGIELLGGRERTSYPFTMAVEDFDHAIGLTTHTLRPIDPVRMGSYMRQALQSLADALESTSNIPLLQLEVLPPEERVILLHDRNSAKMDFPRHQTIHGMFEDQAERTPEAIAVVYEDQQLSYSHLNTCANRLAHHLIGLGVRPDMRVALCVERSLAMVVGALAILKAGGAYVPLDPTYGSGRLGAILADAAPTILIADVDGQTALGNADLSSIVVINPNTEPSNPSTNPHISCLTSRNIAYIIYTSGSTGKPKGVLIEHQGVVNFLMTRQDMCGIRQGSRVLQFSSYGFDGSIPDLYATLGYGGIIYLPPDHIRYNPPLLWDYLRDHSITQAFLPPALLRDC